MSIEVACPACGGSIQIEDVAEVVACPLCQMHLQVDPETSEAVLVTAEGEAADEITAETEDTDSDAALPEEENAGLESVHAFSHPTGEETDQFDLTETEPGTESISPFSFLPGGNENQSSRKQPERPATNFSFLPGGSDAEKSESATSESDVAEAEASPESAAMTTEDETSDETEISEQAETDFEVGSETESTAAEEPVAEESTTTDTTMAETVVEKPAETEAPASEAAASTETPAAETSSEPESPAAQPDYRKQKVVSQKLFTLTLTYAIAATIMVAMLLYAKYLGDPHQLESLPDLKPPIKNDEIALQLVPENAELPPGHTLKLGGPGRRFGNILVTPLRVTRGPLEFEHYTGDKTKTRAPSQDVLKLYLRFENVSSDQTFEPLDQKLLLTRVAGKTQESQLRANNFVSRVDQKQTDGERVLTYDMPPSWEWNLKGQNINQEEKPQNLKPGESFETYVATNEEGIDALKGELVWRIQLRKGYNPKSHRGVTTLIEVVFNSDQIEKETPSQTEDSQATS